jgi:hypothetical protein
MGLAQDLEVLEQQRRVEIRTLHQTYLRTKRTVIRTASPARIVRRHLGVSLAAAAALGMAMAPRPGAPRPVAVAEPAAAPRKSKWGFGGILSKLKPVIHQVAPEVATYIPDAPAESEPPVCHYPEAEKAKRPHPILHAMLVEGATLLLSTIDFSALWERALNLIVPKESGKKDEEREKVEHEPQMEVADVGTVKQQDYEHFQ